MVADKTDLTVDKSDLIRLGTFKSTPRSDWRLDDITDSQPTCQQQTQPLYFTTVFKPENCSKWHVTVATRFIRHFKFIRKNMSPKIKH